MNVKEYSYKAILRYYIIRLYRCIHEEYDLTPSAFNKWVKDYRTTGSFNHKDNMRDAELENAARRKKLKQLEMEVDDLHYQIIRKEKSNFYMMNKNLLARKSLNKLA